jgi:RNA polymerase sigma-70 factor, ECF subfamily
MVSVAGAGERLAREDADLVAHVAAGDIGEPVAELYRRYGGRLYRFGLQLLGNAGLAEELVQECFVRLWRTAGRFDTSRGTVAGYLFVIARSIATDLRRRPSSRPLLPVEDVRVPAQPDSADQIVETLMVRDALDSLSEAHREVLLLVHAEGLTQSQIAERLGLPLGTVKTRMFHGLRALRAALAERGYDG